MPTDEGRTRCHRSQCPVTRRALSLRHRMRSVCARDLIFPALITALVLVAALFPQSQLRDAATYGDVSGMRLVATREFAIFAPFCAMLDMQSLLTVPQHIAMLVTLLVSFAMWRAVTYARGSSFPIWRREFGGSSGAPSGRQPARVHRPSTGRRRLPAQSSRGIREPRYSARAADCAS